MKQFFMGPDGPYQGKLVSDGLERYDDIAAELNAMVLKLYLLSLREYPLNSTRNAKHLWEN